MGCSWRACGGDVLVLPEAYVGSPSNDGLNPRIYMWLSTMGCFEPQSSPRRVDTTEVAEKKVKFHMRPPAAEEAHLG